MSLQRHDDRPAVEAAQPTPAAGHVALVAATDPYTGVGGASLRLRALAAALGGDTSAITVLLACDQRRQCRHRCWADGHEREPFDGPFYLARQCGAYVRRLADLLVSMEVTTVVCSELDCYQFMPDLARDGRLRVVADMHNVESTLVEDLTGAAGPGLGRPGADEIARLERAVVEAVHQVWVPSPDDREVLLRRYADVPDLRVRVVPNVVSPGLPPASPGTVRRVTFTGRLDYLPNQLAAEFLADEVLPALRGRGITLPVVVAGANPDAELTRRLQAAGVELVANPPSTHDLIRDSVLVVPLRLGGGSRLKVLEAFALGAPVISTRKGVEGLAVRRGQHFLLADSANEIARAVEIVTGKATLRGHLVRGARRLVEHRYSVDALTAQLAGILADDEMTPMAGRGEA